MDKVCEYCIKNKECKILNSSCCCEIDIDTSMLAENGYKDIESLLDEK